MTIPHTLFVQLLPRSAVVFVLEFQVLVAPIAGGVQGEKCRICKTIVAYHSVYSNGDSGFDGP